MKKKKKLAAALVIAVGSALILMSALLGDSEKVFAQQYDGFNEIEESIKKDDITENIFVQMNEKWKGYKEKYRVTSPLINLFSLKTTDESVINTDQTMSVDNSETTIDVYLKLKGDDGKSVDELEMYPGQKAKITSYYTIDGDYEDDVEPTWEPDWIEDYNSNNGRFTLSESAEIGKTVTITSTYEGKSKSVTIKVIAKPEQPTLKSVKIEAPNNYTIDNGEMKVHAGDSFTLTGSAETTGGYAFEASWRIGDTYVTADEISSTPITINSTTGEVSVPEGLEAGSYATVMLTDVRNGQGDDPVRATLKLVVEQSAPKPILKGISIKVSGDYEIKDGIIEAYPGSTISLIEDPDMEDGYQWIPEWKVGDTITSAGEVKRFNKISVDESTGEVTVPAYADEGDVAEITLHQKGDSSAMKATVKVRVIYWSIFTTAEPEGLNNVEVKTRPERAGENETVTYYSSYRGVTDSQGQKYIFDHWKTDEANKTLQSINYGVPVNNSTVDDAFKMPRQDVHLTAVYTKSWSVEEKVIGIGQLPTLLFGATDYKEGTEVDTYFFENQLTVRNLVLQAIKVTDSKGNEIDSRIKHDSRYVHVLFTMPADTVTVEIYVAFDPDGNKELTLGEVVGDLVSGSEGTASVEVNAKGYEDGEVLTIAESYSEGTLKDTADCTSGLSFTVSQVTNEKAQVTIHTDKTVPAGRYNFTVTSSNGKKQVTGSVEVKEAEAKSLAVKGASIELEEDATGELSLKGTSLNLQNGTAVKAIETDAKGTEKTFGKTEGLVFDDTTIADNAFTMKAHLSKTVAAGTYYFKVQAGDTVSEVASIVVTRTKKEEPTPPVEEKEYSINASCNPNQGSIEIRVNGAEATKAKKGDKVTLTAVPKSGYRLKNWSLNMDMTTITPSEGTLTDTTISFLMPEGTVTVGAAFESTSTENPDTPTSVAPTITAFVVANVNGVIDQSTGQITVVVPNGTDVTALKPAVAVSDGATVTPSSGTAVNFTDAVVYTVKSASGETKQYVVTVKVQEASVSDSLWDQITNPEGDRSWWKKADSIKSHKKNKYPKYW